MQRRSHRGEDFRDRISRNRLDHGIDVESLDLTTQLWLDVVHDLLG